MVMVTRLAGDKHGKGEGSKGNGDDNEGGERWRGQWQGWQGDGNGNKGGRRADGNSNKEGNGSNYKIRGRRGRQWPTFAHHTTMTHDHGHNGNKALLRTTINSQRVVRGVISNQVDKNEAD
jgi:hypothetical protein